MSVKGEYIYTDESGVPVLRKVRRETDSGRQMPIHAAAFINGRMRWKSAPGSLERLQPEWALKALYHLPMLKSALQCKEPTALAEGERDCDTLIALCKLAATTNWQGAQKFTPEQAEWFTMWGGAREVTIFIDADDPGHWAGSMRYRLLRDAGVAKKRLTILKPRDPAHKDVTDVALAGRLRRDAFVRVSPSEAREVADRYGSERAARYKREDWAAS